MYIYKTTCLVNNKIYIGCSTKKYFENPMYLGSGRLIKNAIKKYGKRCFSKKILVSGITCKELLLALEILYVAIHDSNNLSVGYNLSKGGDNIYKAIGRLNGMNGKKHRKEARESMSKTRRIKRLKDPEYGKLSPEGKIRHSNKLSDRNRTNPTLPNGHSEEAKYKISVNLKMKYSKNRSSPKGN